jgi:calcium permeable stress-gated cation channel
MWKAYAEYINMRQQYFESHEYQSSVHGKALLVMNVPSGLQSDEKVRKWIQNISATYTIQQASIGRRSGMLNEIMISHEKAVRELENVLANYLQGNDSIHHHSRNDTHRLRSRLNRWQGIW